MLIPALLLTSNVQAYGANNITDTNNQSTRPQIITNENKTYFIWEDKTNNDSDIYFQKITASKSSEQKNLSDNTGFSSYPRLSVSGTHVYATWYDYSSGQSDVFFAKSGDDGKIFSVVNLSQNSQASYNPWIVSRDNFVYIVWNDGGFTKQTQIEDRIIPIDIITDDMEIILAV